MINTEESLLKAYSNVVKGVFNNGSSEKPLLDDLSTMFFRRIIVEYTFNNGYLLNIVVNYLSLYCIFLFCNGY
jgi:hypothetical protein